MQEHDAVVAEALDEQVEFTLREVVHLCGISADQVYDLVAEGVAAPEGRSPAQWRFTGTAVVRLQTAVRLERDLGVNRPGVALVLDLLERLEDLRQRLRQLEGE